MKQISLREYMNIINRDTDIQYNFLENDIFPSHFFNDLKKHIKTFNLFILNIGEIDEK